MTGVEWILIVLILLVGFYMAWNIGANDVANAMGTSVGSGALTLKRAVVLAAIFEFAGAYIVGANVSETVRKKMFDPQLLQTFYGDQAALVLACGMVAALLAAGTWLLVASHFGWPVSTTHSIVGSVVGFGCVGVGVANVAWTKVGLITLGWIVSPILSGTIAYLIFRGLLRRVFYQPQPVDAAKRTAPQLVFLVMVVIVGVTAFKGLKPLWSRLGVDPFEWHIMATVAAIAVGSGIAGMVVAVQLVARIETEPRSDDRAGFDARSTRSLGKAAMHLQRVRSAAEGPVHEKVTELLREVERLYETAQREMDFGTDSVELQQVERIFVFLQILTACFVAFAHGANDVANAIGPMSAAYQAVRTGSVALKSGVPTWCLALGGVGIVAGLAMLGWRVIKTVGERITELTPSRGFCAEFAAASTILLASVLPLGLPVSTTHTLVGAVLGVGMARGIGAINLKTARAIVTSWIFTIPIGAGLSLAFFFLLKAIFVSAGAA